MHPTKPNFPRLLRPGLHLTPTLAGELAGVLELAIQQFDGWGLRVRDVGRLHAAVRLLRRFADRGSLGSSPSELKMLAHAASLASDFHLIADSLDVVRPDPIANDIMTALGGTVSADSPDSSPYEYQTQYWVGVLLAQSGLRPGVWNIETARPDFLVRVHDLPCGVEVKRPRSLERARQRLKEAAEQLEAAGVPGIIIVDSSTIVGTNSYILPRPGVDARREIDRLNSEVAGELTSFIHDYSLSDKFKHVMNLVTFARFQVWTSQAPAISDSGCVFSLGGFPRAYAGQVIRYSEELVRRLLGGLERVTNNPVRVRRA